MFFQRPKSGDYATKTLPSPVGGLNAFDSLAAMPETDAVVMQNWWPQQYGCSVRKGYVEWATGMPSTVESLASLPTLSGAFLLFAWSNTAMYDVSTRAVVGAPIVTGLTNARWEPVVVSNAAGNALVCVNGFDDAIIYRSSALRITAGDGITLNTWAGLNPRLAVQCTVHQRRLWAVEKDSTRAWYLPVDAVQGTFVSFDFGALFQRGGFLQYLTTWTFDDNNGTRDFLVAMSSNGEAAVYAGTNPSSDATWGLSGVYYVGRPVAGRRSFTKSSGDLLILTQQGAVSMVAQLVVVKAQQANNPLVSRKIQALISELTTTYAAVFGWSIRYVPAINMLLLNVPSITAGGNVQLALNEITQAWTQFLGMDGVSWVVHNDSLYFGDYNGRVYLAWTGNSDKVLLDNTGGVGITAAVQQAYSYFDARTKQKQIGLYKPTIVTGGSFAYNSEIVYDYSTKDVPTPGSVPPSTASLWNSGVWNSAFWAGGTRVSQSWKAAGGVGVAASLKMVSLTTSDILWIATDITVRNADGVL